MYIYLSVCIYRVEEERKEMFNLFNNALNTFYLQ